MEELFSFLWRFGNTETCLFSCWTHSEELEISELRGCSLWILVKSNLLTVKNYRCAADLQELIICFEIPKVCLIVFCTNILRISFTVCLKMKLWEWAEIYYSISVDDSSWRFSSTDNCAIPSIRWLSTKFLEDFEKGINFFFFLFSTVVPSKRIFQK